MVTLKRGPGELRLTVADDGQGLDPRRADTAGWSTASPNSSAARSSGRATAGVLPPAPSGDPNDNANLVRFSEAVRKIAPQATGEPVVIQQSGKTVVEAFAEAGAWALLSISVLLFIVLGQVTDVLLTLIPLALAAVVTLELTALIGMPLNFANIIALPLLLGVGVAFKIYCQFFGFKPPSSDGKRL